MMENNRHELYSTLTRAGIRPSLQRLTILEYIRSCVCHPTADEVYSHLVIDHPMLSRTTVFSCLKLFVEKGLVNDIDISSDSTRYDDAHRTPHGHFMCRECHKIFDMPLDMSALKVGNGFVCDNVNVFFKGLCPECSTRTTDNSTTNQTIN